MFSHCYDRQGNPITYEDWADVFSDYDYRVVKKDELGDVQVSTVWLGLDHNFLGEGPPLIFETMIFGENPHDLDQWRYSTEEEAERQHYRIAAALSENICPHYVTNEECYHDDCLDFHGNQIQEMDNANGS